MVNGEQCRTTEITEEFKSECRISRTPINLAPQESLLPLKTMSRFAEPVIPEVAQSACGGESRKKAATGYRISPATSGLVRYDDCLLPAAKQKQGEIFCNGQRTTDY